MPGLVVTAPVRATEPPPVVARPSPASTDLPIALDKIGQLIRFEEERKIAIEGYIICIGESKEYTKCLEEYTKCLEEYTKGLERIKLRIANLRGFEAYFKSIGNTEDTIKAYGWGVYCDQMSPNDSEKRSGQPEKTGISSVDTIDIIKKDGTWYRFKLNSSFQVQKERLNEKKEFFPKEFDSIEYYNYYVKDSQLKHKDYRGDLDAIATTLTDSLLYKDHLEKKFEGNPLVENLAEAAAAGAAGAAPAPAPAPLPPPAAAPPQTPASAPPSPSPAVDELPAPALSEYSLSDDEEGDGSGSRDESLVEFQSVTRTPSPVLQDVGVLSRSDTPPPPVQNPAPAPAPPPPPAPISLSLPDTPPPPPPATTGLKSAFAPDESGRSPELTESFNDEDKRLINDLMKCSGDYASFSFWSRLYDTMKINIKKKIFDPAIPDTREITGYTIEAIRTKIADFHNSLYDFRYNLTSCADDFINKYKEDDTIETWIGADYDNFLRVYQLYCVTQKFPDYFLMFCYQTSGIIPGLFSNITDRGRFFEKLKGYFEGNTISSKEGYEEAVKTFMEQAGSTSALALSEAAKNIVDIINECEENLINKFFLEKYFYDNCGINEKMGFRRLVNQLDIIEEDKELLLRIFNDHKKIKDMSGGDLIKFGIRTDE